MPQIIITSYSTVAESQRFDPGSGASVQFPFDLVQSR